MTTRRRFLSIAATAGTLAGLGLPVRATPAVTPGSVWRGTALGAPAALTLVHPDRRFARATIAACVAEIERLEAIFSLYRPQSAISQLNRDGTLRTPPAELVELLSFALSLARASQGAFDPTVQPLYRTFAEHFAHAGATPAGPGRQAIARAQAAVDHQHVELEAGRIRLHRPGMAITLNGVAQGFITDRVGALLRRTGFEHVLVDVGEALAIGRRADGEPWRAAVADPHEHGRTLFELELGTAPGALPALATSAGGGTRFSPSSRLHHLLDPRSGTSAMHHAAVTVAAAHASLADGLSTALSIIEPSRAAGLLARWPEARAWLVDDQGEVVRLGTA